MSRLGLPTRLALLTPDLIWVCQGSRQQRNQPVKMGRMCKRLPRPGGTGTVLVLLVLWGLGLRLYHYLRDPSMWHDEAALVLNVLDKDWRALLGPLRFSEAAPPLFLWLQRGTYLVLGDSTLALRLPVLLASCLALVLFVPAAKSALPAAAVPWAVFLFASSDRLLWHTCEAKPYAFDVLSAVVVLLLYVRTTAWLPAWRFGLAAVLAPVLIFLSYPGCFLYGGLLVAFLTELRHDRRHASWLTYGLLAVAVFGSFAFLAAGPALAQRDDTILRAWVGAFPPWQEPWRVPHWTFLSTLEVFRYAFEPAGQALAPMAVVGAVLLCRAGRGPLASLLLVPVGLAFVAACLQRYPYGGARVLAYATPGLAVVVAAGVPETLVWLRRWGRFAPACLVGLFLLPGVQDVRRIFWHWPRADCAGAAAHVLNHWQDGDLVAYNHWEYEYYFRHLGPAAVSIAPDLNPCGRLWMVITDADPLARGRQARFAAPVGWNMVVQRELERTSVFLFQRGSPGLSDL